MLHKINNAVVAAFPMWDFTNLAMKTGQAAGLSLEIIDIDHTTSLATYTLAGADIVESGATGIYYVDGDIPLALFNATGTYMALWLCSVGGCENCILELIEINTGDINTLVSGIGSSQLTLTINDAGGAPMADVNVAIWNSAQDMLVTWGQTNSSGELVRNMADGTYKVLCRKAAYVFTTPETVAVAGATAATITSVASAPTAPTGLTTCRVYEYCFMPDGVTPMTTVDAKAKIVSLPEDLGGLLLTGETIEGVYDASTGLVYWDVPQTARVQFTIQDFGIRQTETIPASATERLVDIS